MGINGIGRFSRQAIKGYRQNRDRWLYIVHGVGILWMAAIIGFASAHSWL